MKKYTIEITQDDIIKLNNLMDIALKALGLEAKPLVDHFIRVLMPQIKTQDESKEVVEKVVKEIAKEDKK